jgi:hypothetical protein
MEKAKISINKTFPSLHEFSKWCYNWIKIITITSVILDVCRGHI